MRRALALGALVGLVALARRLARLDVTSAAERLGWPR
jgi:hypothetical protein